MAVTVAGRLTHWLCVAVVVVEASAAAIVGLMVLAAWKANQAIDWAEERVRIHRLIRAEWIDD